MLLMISIVTRKPQRHRSYTQLRTLLKSDIILTKQEGTNPNAKEAGIPSIGIFFNERSFSLSTKPIDLNSVFSLRPNSPVNTNARNSQPHLSRRSVDDGFLPINKRVKPTRNCRSLETIGLNGLPAAASQTSFKDIEI